MIKTTTGGQIDFWTLENENAGRGRKYHLVIIDEAAFVKATEDRRDYMVRMWRENIRPTLVDYRGSALAMSNTKGLDKEQFFWQICNEPKHQFAEHYAPSSSNPHLSHEELEEIRHNSHPLVWQQEYLAEFVDWSGKAFFAREKLLENNAPVPYPVICDSVYAVIDTAIKTGRQHDGTAVTYFALSRYYGIPLIVLDWNIVQIEGALLELWLPSVYERGEQLARQCRARQGFVGAWIEDKASGMILLQQAQKRMDQYGNPWRAYAIDSALTAVGKDERAINVSTYVYCDKVKFSDHAFNKTTLYKEHEANHQWDQVVGYRVGVKAPQEDDLLDTFCYGIALGLGNEDGF